MRILIYAKLKLVEDVRKALANFRWFTTPTSTMEMRFSESTPQPFANLPSETEWLTGFETPASDDDMQNFN